MSQDGGQIMFRTMPEDHEYRSISGSMSTMDDHADNSDSPSMHKHHRSLDSSISNAMFINHLPSFDEARNDNRNSSASLGGTIRNDKCSSWSEVLTSPTSGIEKGEYRLLFGNLQS